MLEIRGRFAKRGARLTVIRDGLEAYDRALQRPVLRDRYRSATFPDPARGPKESPRPLQARQRDAALGPNDHWHNLVQHSLAHKHKGTIAFPRRANAFVERLFVMQAWRNFVKGVSERKPDPTTPAMRKGLTDRPWIWARVLARRLFPERLSVPECWLEICRREWITPSLARNTRHNLVRAF